MIFENAEVRSLAMQVGFANDCHCDPALLALTVLSETMDLRIVFFEMS